MVPLVVIRPEPGCSATVDMARSLGLETVGQPLFVIEPRSWQAPVAAQFDALLIGSANVLRHGGRGLAGLKALPVHAVGESTAQAARALGFSVASTGSGGLQAVLDSLPAGHRRLLRLTGDERVPLVVPEVNAPAIAGYKGRGIIANPNCSTIQMVVALKPIHEAAGIKRVVVSTYQSTSGAGKEAMDELFSQTRAVFVADPAGEWGDRIVATGLRAYLDDAGDLHIKDKPERLNG